MKRRLFAMIITCLFLTLVIGAFSSVTAKIGNKSISQLEEEGPCSIKINFVTQKGEEYIYRVHLTIDLIFSIPKGKFYVDWIDKEDESSSMKIENLPAGLYRLSFGFTGGYITILPRFVLVGEGKLIPTHKEITVKVIDLSYP